MEDAGNVNVSNEIVVLVGSGSNLDSSNENVLDTSGVIVGLDGGENLIEVGIGMNVESTIPLSIFVSKWDMLAIGKLRVNVGTCC